MSASSSTSNPPAAEKVRDGVEPRIADGVFLADPGVLPRGRHGLTREQVREVQRERLLIAATELLAAHGYRGFGAGEIAGRAGVSLAAFYDCFENKDACVFAGYDRFIEVLLERMGSVPLDGQEPDRAGRDAPRRLPGDAAERPGRGARVPGRDRRPGPGGARTPPQLVASVRRLHPRGGRAHRARRRAPDVLSPSAYIGVVYAARQLASDALDIDAEPDLVGLGDDMRPWLADLFRLR